MRSHFSRLFECSEDRIIHDSLATAQRLGGAFVKSAVRFKAGATVISHVEGSSWIVLKVKRNVWQIATKFKSIQTRAHQILNTTEFKQVLDKRNLSKMIMKSLRNLKTLHSEWNISASLSSFESKFESIVATMTFYSSASWHSFSAHCARIRVTKANYCCGKSL